MAAQLTLPPVAILCGGMATRLKPISDTIPKALVEVGGKPFMHYQLTELRRQSITDVVLCVGHKGEMIEAAIGDGGRYDLSVQYSYDGESALGTGGALRKAMHLLGDSFFVLYGDAYLQLNYMSAFQTFINSGKKGLMTVYMNSGKWDSSNVLFENQQIRAYSKSQKTPKMLHIDYGLGILQAAAIEAYSADQEFDLAEVYEQLVQKNELAAFEVHERFYEIGSHDGLQEFRAWLASHGGDLSRAKG
jgi:NDP-sugar pyrophosphorylase family protein